MLPASFMQTEIFWCNIAHCNLCDQPACCFHLLKLSWLRLNQDKFNSYISENNTWSTHRLQSCIKIFPLAWENFLWGAYRRYYLNMVCHVSKMSVNRQDSNIIVKSIDQNPKSCESMVQSRVQSMVQSSPEFRYCRHLVGDRSQLIFNPTCTHRMSLLFTSRPWVITKIYYSWWCLTITYFQIILL